MFVSRYVGRPLAGADPGRHRRAVRRQLAAHRRRRTAASWWSCGRRRSRPEREQPVDELLGATLGPGVERVRPGDDRRSRTSATGTGTSPDLAMSSTGPGRRRLPRRRTATSSTAIPLLRPGDVDRAKCASRTTTASAGRSSARSTATPGVSMRPPTAGQRARRSRSARPATASSSGRSRKSKASRASGRGGCSGARSTTCCRSAPRAFAARRSRRRRRAERRGLAARPGGGRLPPGGRAGLAAARARGSSSTRCPTANRPSGAQFVGAEVADTAVSGGGAARGRAAEHRHRRKAANCGCSTTATARRA